jgi:hypothetical protein
MDEDKWIKAKQRAAEEGHAGEYDYIVGIYKKMKGRIKGKAGVKKSALAIIAR